MKKRFLATLLSVVMVITFFPIVAHAATVANAQEAYDRFYAQDPTLPAGALTILGETITVHQNVRLRGTVFSLDSPVTLDLFGHTVSFDMDVSLSKGTLTIMDSGGFGKISNSNGISIRAYGGTLLLNAEVIGGNGSVAAVTVEDSSTSSGNVIGSASIVGYGNAPAVNVNGGTYTMEGGVVTGSKPFTEVVNADTPYSAVVNINNGGTFIMNKGTITNTNTTGIIAVRVGSGSTATMNNGEIFATYGVENLGTVAVEGGTFTMNGGIINGDRASAHGIVCDGYVTVSGGRVYGSSEDIGIKLKKIEGISDDSILTLKGVQGKYAYISGIRKLHETTSIIISENTKVLYRGVIQASMPDADYYPGGIVVSSNNPTYTITTENLPDGVVGTPYSAQLESEPPVVISENHWQIIDGTIPPGIIFLLNGALSATPTTAGEWVFYASVISDGNNPELLAAKKFAIKIVDTYSISASPTILDFAADEGYTPASAAQSVTITNTGSGSISLNAPVLATGTNFTIITPAGFTDAFANNTTKTFSVQPVAGLMPGIYTDTVTVTGSNNTSATVNVSFAVRLVPVAPDITTDPANARVAVGSSATFTIVATGKPAPTYQWQVSANGTVWADVADGTGADSASYTTPATTLGMNGWQYRCVVTNSEGNATSEPALLNVYTPVSGVTVTPATARIAVAKTVQLAANVLPVDAANKDIIWSTSDESVATVSSTGLVTAVKAGVATITATTDDGDFKDTCVVTVYVPVSGVTVTPETASIAVAKTAQLAANVLPDDAATKTVTWSTSDENIATVSSTGLVTAVKAGVATITATTDDGDFKDTCVVTVYIPVSGVTVTPATARIAVAKTAQLTANVLPVDAANKDIIWSSSDESIATVSSTGLVTAVKAGVATITATTDDGDFADTCVVTVYIPVSGVTVTPETARIAVAKTVQLAANVLPVDAATKTVIWSSSDESIATVSSTGLVTAVKAGVATITATTDDGGFTAACAVTIYTPSISITQNGKELNGTLLIRVPWFKAYKNVSFNLGYIANTEDYARVEWSSDNEKVIVDQNGQVTNVKTSSRSTIITVKMYDAQGNVIATDKVNITINKFNYVFLKLLVLILKLLWLSVFKVWF